MKKRRWAGLATGLVMLGVVGGAQATTIEIHQDVTLSPTQIQNVWPEGLQSWGAFSSAPFGTSLVGGDTLSITYDFIGGSLRMADLGLRIGCWSRSPCYGEGVFFAIGGAGLISAQTSSSYSFEFVSPTGDLTINPVNGIGIFRMIDSGHQLQATINQGQTFSVLPELTDSFFQFKGINLTLSIPETVIGPWQPNFYTNIEVLADQITIVPTPEPTTIILFGTGIAGLVGTRLRRKKQ